MAFQFEPDPPMVACPAGDGMRFQRHIPWFNPRELDDETLLALSTGRSDLLADLFAAIQERLEHPGLFRHWLLTGTRGAGKSFFLRFVQASFAAAFGSQARFVLLPEEHANIFAPHEFLAEVQRMLQGGAGNPGVPPAWRVADAGAAWLQALDRLLGSFDEPLLVIGVENFDQLLAQAFDDDTDSARLRRLMSGEPRIMLVATAVQGDFDDQYDQRLFRQFEHHPVPRWDADDHRDYLKRRAGREGTTPSELQLARIDAYSRYTGGNPRAAAVLAAAILDEHDPLEAASDLDAAIDSMSDYYRALIERIPAKTRKLFDALIRMGDPASQTEIARRTGAQQNEISRAFIWLVDNGYVRESRDKGQKSKQYQVIDRLFVQFYRMRYIEPGQRSKLALMADLLADTIAFHDKWGFARKYALIGEDFEARTMAELALKERQINPGLLPESDRSVKGLLELGECWQQFDMLIRSNFSGQQLGEQYKKIAELYPTDTAFKEALEKSIGMLKASGRGDISGVDVYELLRKSIIFSPLEMYWIIVHSIGVINNEEIWGHLRNELGKEAGIINNICREKNGGEYISLLYDLQQLGVDYPLSASFLLLSDSALRDNGRGVIDLATAVRWARLSILEKNFSCRKNILYFGLTTLVAILDEVRASGCPDYEKILIESISDVDTFISHADVYVPIRLWVDYAFALLELQSFRESCLAFEKAKLVCVESDKKVLANFCLGKMALSLGCMGEVERAIEIHLQAADEAKALGEPSELYWNIGQIARYLAIQDGGKHSWQFIDRAWSERLSKDSTAIPDIVRQLGDAIADCAKANGVIGAFVLAVELLQELSIRNQQIEPSLRSFWIRMIELEISFPLLRDLLAEWPNIFAGQYPDLQGLNQLLCAWLDDLETPAAMREQRRKTLDPDMATTFAALEENFSPKARLRFGLPAKAVAG